MNDASKPCISQPMRWLNVLGVVSILSACSVSAVEVTDAKPDAVPQTPLDDGDAGLTDARATDAQPRDATTDAVADARTDAEPSPWVREGAQPNAMAANSLFPSVTQPKRFALLGRSMLDTNIEYVAAVWERGATVGQAREFRRGASAFLRRTSGRFSTNGEFVGGLLSGSVDDLTNDYLLLRAGSWQVASIRRGSSWPLLGVLTNPITGAVFGRTSAPDRLLSSSVIAREEWVAPVNDAVIVDFAADGTLLLRLNRKIVRCTMQTSQCTEHQAVGLSPTEQIGQIVPSFRSAAVMHVLGVNSTTNDGTWYLTTDSGDTLVPVQAPPALTWNGTDRRDYEFIPSRFSPQHLCVRATTRALPPWVSRDGGSTWREAPPPYPGTLVEAAAYDVDNHLFISNVGFLYSLR